jgi:hypothetical protein
MRIFAALLVAGCASGAIHPTVGPIPGHEKLVALDTSPKERRRMVPPEVYVRTYLALFGGLAPLAAQNVARGAGKQNGQLFDTWDDYLSALGLPDYRIDQPRAEKTNALMMATFERLGVALCDRAVEHDLRPGGLGPPLIFTFDAPATLDEPGFATRFDALHRAFLGYPASLAPPSRVERFYKLYQEVVAHHGKSLLSPVEAGWAAVCYGLVRHPEFILY